MIVVDVETTGIYPLKTSIVSVGALDFSNPRNTFYEECRIWEGAEIIQEALNINGFTREQITDPRKQSLEELMKKFLEWTSTIKNITLAGENPSFDGGFLMNSAMRYGIEWPFGRRTLDLHSVRLAHHISSEKEFPMKNNRADLNLDRTLVYVGLPREPRPHNALVGAKFEAEAFSRLINGKNLLPEFIEYEIPEYLKY